MYDTGFKELVRRGSINGLSILEVLNGVGLREPCPHVGLYRPLLSGSVVVVVMWMMMMTTMMIDDDDDDDVMSVDGTLEVSHLCHEPLCINAEHVSLEPHSCTRNRLRCVNRGVCHGHKSHGVCCSKVR